MLKFEDEIPKEFRNQDQPIVVRSVGELIDQLSKLPRDLSLDGYFCRGAYSIRVIKILGWEERLACSIEGYDDREINEE